ncbi:MAG: hypothetical protein QXT53_05880 [Ignisphaera sp.]
MDAKRFILIAIAAVAIASIVGIATLSYVEAQTSNNNNGNKCICQCGNKTITINVPLYKTFKWQIQIKWQNPFGFRVRKGAVQQNIVVSDEYKQKVLNIIQSDANVSRLLAEGYNVTMIRPVFQAYVQGDGTVTLRASQAVAVLSIKTSNKVGIAYVFVNVDQGKVEKIVTFERTITMASNVPTTTTTPSTSL